MQLTTSSRWFTALAQMNHTEGKKRSPQAIIASQFDISYKFKKSLGKLVMTKTEMTQMSISESWRSLAYKKEMNCMRNKHISAFRHLSSCNLCH